MTELTPVQVLAEILKEGSLFRKSPPSSGCEVTIRLTTDRPPLKIRDGNGYWILQGWAELGDHWQLEYRYQRSEYYIIVMGPDGGCAEVDDTRTIYQGDAEKMVEALNLTITSKTARHPFRVEQG